MEPMEFKDYYQVLGVSPDADEKAIRQAFRKLARQYHPDVNPGDKAAEEQFKAGDVEEASSGATEALDLGIRSGLFDVVAESRRMLALVAARRGQHEDAERLLEEAAAANEQAGDRYQLALILTVRAHFAFGRGVARRRACGGRRSSTRRRDYEENRRLPISKRRK